MKVDVYTSSPILHMDVDADDFGKLFARMASDEQVAVLRAMVEHMKPHQIQWDYIQTALEYPGNDDLRLALGRIFATDDT